MNNKKLEKLSVISDEDAFIKWLTKIQTDVLNSLRLPEEYFKEKITLKENEYQCEQCKGIFTKGWTDKEALNETKELFGDVPVEELSVICDDCFNKLFGEEK